MNIRTATLQDIDQIAAVEKECFPAAEAATKEEFEQRLSHYGDHFWLMFEDDKLIAFVDGMVTDQEDLTDEMYEKAELHEEESLRQLHIQAYWDDEEMVFHVSNYINETVLDRNSGLATTKEDKNSHGLGTNIVKSLAKRNYGTCDYYETENEFRCEIRW